jgi:hypothetical protein
MSRGGSMFGIILDAAWSAGEDPVTVIVAGDLDFLRNLPFMDCANPEDAWDRGSVERIEPISKTCSNDGQVHNAHICRRV